MNNAGYYRSLCIETLGNQFVKPAIELRDCLDAIEQAKSDLKDLDNEIKENTLYKKKSELNDIINRNKKRIEKLADGYQFELF